MSTITVNDDDPIDDPPTDDPIVIDIDPPTEDAGAVDGDLADPAANPTAHIKKSSAKDPSGGFALGGGKYSSRMREEVGGNEG